MCWGGGHSTAENSPGRLHGCAHGLFILRISAGDLRAGLWTEAGWLTAHCESDRWMEFRRLWRNDVKAQIAQLLCTRLTPNQANCVFPAVGWETQSPLLGEREDTGVF